MGIQFQSYSPLGYGMFKKENERTVMSHPVVSEIAKKHGKSSAQVRSILFSTIMLSESVLFWPASVWHFLIPWSMQVALRWATQSGVGTNPLSLIPSEMQQNLDSFLFDLDEADFTAIRELDCNFHYLRPQDWYGLPYWEWRVCCTYLAAIIIFKKE